MKSNKVILHSKFQCIFLVPIFIGTFGKMVGDTGQFYNTTSSSSVSVLRLLAGTVDANLAKTAVQGDEFVSAISELFSVAKIGELMT